MPLRKKGVRRRLRFQYSRLSNGKRITNRHESSRICANGRRAFAIFFIREDLCEFVRIRDPLSEPHVRSLQLSFRNTLLKRINFSELEDQREAHPAPRATPRATKDRSNPPPKAPRDNAAQPIPAATDPATHSIKPLDASPRILFHQASPAIANTPARRRCACFGGRRRNGRPKSDSTPR